MPSKWKSSRKSRIKKCKIVGSIVDQVVENRCSDSCDLQKQIRNGLGEQQKKLNEEMKRIPRSMKRIEDIKAYICANTPPKRHEMHHIKRLEEELITIQRYVNKLKGGILERRLRDRVDVYMRALDAADDSRVKATPVTNNNAFKSKKKHQRRAKRQLPKEKRLVRVQKNSNSSKGNINTVMIFDEFNHEFNLAAPPIYIVTGDNCSFCKIGQMRKIIEKSMMCCNSCGNAVSYVDTTATSLGYGEDADFATFSYRRDNHFREWLQCFQGKESTTIPITVLAAISQELHNLCVKPKNIKQATIRTVLKKLKVLIIFNCIYIFLCNDTYLMFREQMRKFYENTSLITCLLTGRKPPRLSVVEEEQLRRMFQAIQIPFEKHCPNDRKNFLSYSYCLYKFCELLNLDKYLKHFTLLKGRDKLFKQDMIFRKICDDLKWQYIRASRAIFFVMIFKLIVICSLPCQQVYDHKNVVNITRRTMDKPSVKSSNDQNEIEYLLLQIASNQLTILTSLNKLNVASQKKPIKVWRNSGLMDRIHRRLKRSLMMKRKSST